jgi:hypothetical protein
MRFATDHSETLEVFFATCGLRQITVKLWKTRIKNAISPIPAVSTSPFGVLKNRGAQTN